MPFPEQEQTFLIPGPVGDLEILATPAPDLSLQRVAIICHPHPLYGGSMHNKVLTMTAKALADLGLATLRFNFRGVGKSAGVFAEGQGEAEDLEAVINWVQAYNPQLELWLAGFSFGSYVAALVSTRMTVKQLICIAPPVVNFPFHQLPPILCSLLVVQGEADEVVCPQAVFAWVETLNPKPDVLRMAETSHFFHKKLLELRSGLVERLKKPL